MVLNSPARESESVAVAKAAVTAQAAPATVNGLMARNEAPAIEKAKPAPPEILDQKTATQEAAANAELKAGGAASPVARSATNYAYLVKKDTLAKQAAPNFSLRISAGLLQRSVDDGVTWQAGLHTDHPLTCFVQRASEVWAGGEAGTCIPLTRRRGNLGRGKTCHQRSIAHHGHCGYQAQGRDRIYLHPRQ